MRHKTAPFIILITIITMITTISCNKDQSIIFKQGDNLSGYTVLDESNQQVKFEEIIDKPTLLIFAWDKCGDCITEFSSYELLSAFYNTEDFQVVYVWEKNLSNNLSLPQDKMYYLKDRKTYTEWVPTYMLIDSNLDITYMTISLEEMFNIIKGKYQGNKNGLNNLLLNNSILLGLERCSSCKKEIESATDVDFTYYLHETTDMENYKDDDYIKNDPYGILSEVLDIDTYPMWIYSDDKGNIIVSESK